MGAGRWRGRAVGGAVLVALALGTAACGSDGPAATSSTTLAAPPTTEAPPPVARQVLGRVPAPEAPGYDQYLLRVTIQPGAELAEHRHPGLEVAHIEQGELTYEVTTGVALVGRAGAEGPTEEVAAPATTVLRAGDTVYELADMHHAAANRGGEPVVVLLASLLRGDEPISIPIG